MSTQTLTPHTEQSELTPCVPCLNRKKIEVPGVRMVAGESWCADCFRGDGPARPSRDTRKPNGNPVRSAIVRLMGGQTKTHVNTKNCRADMSSAHSYARRLNVKIKVTKQSEKRFLIERVD